MSALTAMGDSTYRHVVDTEGGGHIRFVARPGHVLLIQRRFFADGRPRDNTTTMPLDQIRLTHARLGELIKVAEAEAEARRQA